MNKHGLFIHEGNAIILIDREKNAYVGIAFAEKVGDNPIFATISTKTSYNQDYRQSLLFIADSLQQGLEEEGFKLTKPVVIRDSNKALITGNGERYAVGVGSGTFSYACRAEGVVTDEMMVEVLKSKMRCQDRD